MQQDYVEKPLPELCYQQKERPLLLVEQHPSNTVNSRYENIQSSSNDISRGSREHQHCHERQQLAAKHRAEHEMLRKKVLFSIRHVLSTWDIELSSNKNFSTIVESATKWFDEGVVIKTTAIPKCYDASLEPNDNNPISFGSILVPGNGENSPFFLAGSCWTHSRHESLGSFPSVIS